MTHWPMLITFGGASSMSAICDLIEAIRIVWALIEQWVI